MKEAAGEANMTIVTVVLIAIVLGIGTIVVTNLMNNVEKDSTEMENGKTACENVGGTWNNGTCTRK